MAIRVPLPDDVPLPESIPDGSTPGPAVLLATVAKRLRLLNASVGASGGIARLNSSGQVVNADGSVATGQQGPAGATGPTGPVGPAGLNGATGPAGATGPQGPSGVAGPAGPQGPTGATGATGPAGSTGLTFLGSFDSTATYQIQDSVARGGVQYFSKVANNQGHTPNGEDSFWGVLVAAGPQGPAGPQGSTGAQGLTGATGPTGPQGATGATGLTGPQGPQGVQGATGTAGVAGPAGATGPAGQSTYQAWLALGNSGTQAQFIASQTGPQGPTGSQGPAGTAGVQGPTGATGPTGPQGLTGSIGPSGPAGASGLSAYQSWIAAGNSGTQAQFVASLVGPQGPTGATGAAGATGATGPAGATGPTGAQGPAGAAGVDGVASVGLAEVSADIDEPVIANTPIGKRNIVTAVSGAYAAIRLTLPSLANTLPFTIRLSDGSTTGGTATVAVGGYMAVFPSTVTYPAGTDIFPISSQSGGGGATLIHKTGTPFTIPSTAPNVPTGVTVAATGSVASVAWTAPASGPAPLCYTVYRAPGNGDPARPIVGYIFGTAIQVAGHSAGDTYAVESTVLGRGSGPTAYVAVTGSIAGPTFSIADMSSLSDGTVLSSSTSPWKAINGSDPGAAAVMSSGRIAMTTGVGAAKWTASTTYALNALISPTTPNGHLYKVTTAGTSGTTEPVWTTGTSAVQPTDGSVVWTENAGVGATGGNNSIELLQPGTASGGPAFAGLRIDGGLQYKDTISNASNIAQTIIALGLSSDSNPVSSSTRQLRLLFPSPVGVQLAGKAVGADFGAGAGAYSLITPPAALRSTAYQVGDVRLPTTSNAHMYQCTTAGTTGTAEPPWPTGTGVTITDGTVVWVEHGSNQTARIPSIGNGSQAIVLVLQVKPVAGDGTVTVNVLTDTAANFDTSFATNGVMTIVHQVVLTAAQATALLLTSGTPNTFDVARWAGRNGTAASSYATSLGGKTGVYVGGA